MAEGGGDESLEEKTEDATQSRRDEWRSQGQVSQSKEVGAALVVLATTGAIYISSTWAFSGIRGLFNDLLGDLNHFVMRDWSAGTVIKLGSYVAKMLLYILGPIVGAALVVGIVGTLLQVGFLWTTRPLEPDLDRINPLSGLKRIFSLDGLFETFKAAIKFIIVGVVAYIFLKDWVFQAGGLWDVEAAGVSVFLGRHAIKILFVIGLSMFIMALLDYGFQKFRYEQRIKMTKQEAKQERKQVEGNPQVKARIRAIQRQVATRKMTEAVRKADVIVTNPTHIAVALIYDRENMFAPRVVAKGADFMAEQIKKIAREAGVPCVENVPLARALFKALKVGQFIPRDLYNAVAEVLAYVYRLKGKVT